MCLIKNMTNNYKINFNGLGSKFLFSLQRLVVLYKLVSTTVLYVCVCVCTSLMLRSSMSIIIELVRSDGG